MVYPRRDGSRSLATFVTLCAVTSWLFQGVAVAKVHRKQASSVAASTCEAVSAGDAAAGILIVKDSSCATGGTGCIDTTCRFCKTEDTPKSSHFIECGKIGWTPAPGEAPPAVAASTPSAPIVAVPGVDTGCPYDVSPGDYSVGVQLVGDATCVKGGVGCFENICRYCKYRETPQSSHLTGCKNLGVDFSTTTALTTTAPTTSLPVFNPADIGDAPSTSSIPVVDTGCPYAVSEGDAGVGIQLVGDVTCVNGGVGCFADVCRFCKYQDTPQSKHLTACKDLGVDFGTQPLTATTAPTTTPSTSAPPVPTSPPTSVPTTAPVAVPTTAPVSVPTTAPAPEPQVPGAHVVDASTGCPYPVSEGDFKVGIQLVGDATCAAGGVGCFKDVCRYCKFQETSQSSHLPSCGDFGYPRTETPTFAPVDIIEPVVDSSAGCAFPATEGDLKVGIQLVGDASCTNGGLGCFKGVCRYCQYRKTAQSGHLMSCKDLGFDFAADSDAPDPTTGAPVTASPVVPPVDASTGCPYPVSEGDFKVGIQLVGDAECAAGGLGCYKSVCRYCKFQETQQSKHLLSCGAFGYPRTEAPTFAPVDIIDPEPTDDDGSNSAMPTETPDIYDGSNDDEVPEPTTTNDTVAPPADDTPTPPADDMPSPPADDTPLPPAYEVPNFGTGCPYPVSDGDLNVGIQLVGDASCIEGGLGCFKDVCRFCQFRKTSQSGHLMTCKGLGYDLGSGSDASEPTTDSPVLPPVDPATGCPYPVPEGDFAVGIQLVGDDTCAAGGLGCFKNVCRYCKYQETSQSKHLLSCGDFGYPRTEAPTFAPVDIVDPVVDPLTGCAFPVTEGDLKVGIQLVGDATCANGGLGCFKNVCRYCKFKETAKSGHLTSCKDLGFDFGVGLDASDPTTAAPMTTSPVGETNCPLSVTEGDTAVGIQLLTDPACASGGLGCVADVCRFCKFRDTPQSTHLLDCASFSSSKPAPSDGIPIGQPTDVTTDKCPFTASEGDLYIGVQIIEDTTCDIGGIGCFHDACRFCKFFDTDKSSHLEDCSAFGFNFEPIATTAAPRPGVATTPPPATPPPSDPVDPFGEVCDQSVSEGDKKVGIEMVTDASCLSGGVGCVADSVCRYCKAKETGANLHMVWCSTITGVAIDTPAPGAVDTPAHGAGDTPTPASGVTSEPTTATVTPGAGTATKCGQTVSEGDKNAGIDMITDATCIGGGVGCLPDSSCRFCKRSESAASGHLLWCPDIDTYTTPAPVMPTNAPAISTTAPPADVTIAPVVTTAAPVPAGPAVDASAPCDQTLSEGDYNEGVGLATDPGCASGGLGCLPHSTCRYCKHWVTTASSHLDWCGGFDGYAPPPPTPVTAISATNTPAPTIDPTTCSTEVSAGDAEAGVAAVHDEQCVGGGIGCFGGVCRFCQVFETEQSANFLPCASMVTTIAPLRAAARVRAESSASTKNALDDLFKDKTFKWSVVGAACVGVVAVVALFGLGAKRAVTRKGSRKSTVEEATADVETEKDVATVTAASPSDSDDAGLEEVHV